jgi:hypothetical protein
MSTERSSPLHKAWANMKSRCNNPNHPQYEDYGGRGIKVCPEWVHTFRQFENDMGPKPTDDFTLERRDNNKGYSLENCYWATRLEQNRNQSRTRKVLIEGVEYIASELADRYGLSTGTIVIRTNKGRTFSEITSKEKYPTCLRGHPMIDGNIYTKPNGNRQCLICMRTTRIAYREKLGLRQCWSKPILVEVL